MNEKKLIKIYEDAFNTFYNNMSNINQKSKHWKKYDLRKFNSNNLINFRSSYDSLSSGLDDQHEPFSFKIFALIINELSEDYVLNNLPKKNIGNSDVLIKYKNCYLDYNKLIHIHWFNTIENEILKKKKISNICEIGGGFGSFAELIIRNYNTKLLSIDLPEANLMTAYYLKENFPDKKFYLFNEYKKNNILSFDDFVSNDIIILPPNSTIDPKIKIDFFINTRSMMEMEIDVIKSYFNFIQSQSHNESYFLNINRYEKTSVGEPIRISEYPYDANWKVILSKPNFNQDWIHFLITKRNFDINQKDIKQELDRIKILGKKFYGKYNDYSSPFSAQTSSNTYLKTKIIITKILKIIFGVKLLNFMGNIIFKIGNKLKNIK